MRHQDLKLIVRNAELFVIANSKLDVNQSQN